MADLKREVRQSLHNTNSHTQTGIEHEWTCCQGDKKKQRPRPPPSCFTQWCHQLPPAPGGPLANWTKALEGAACPRLFFFPFLFNRPPSSPFIRCPLTRPLVFCPSLLLTHSTQPAGGRRSWRFRSFTADEGWSWLERQGEHYAAGEAAKIFNFSKREGHH